MEFLSWYIISGGGSGDFSCNHASHALPGILKGEDTCRNPPHWQALERSRSQQVLLRQGRGQYGRVVSVLL